ncbi:hypothetical protein K443DRAFT_101652, partial [Laccaria amethystina LaAM-08-1]
CQPANNSPEQPMKSSSPPVPTLHLEQRRITPHIASPALMTQQDELQVKNETEVFNVEFWNKIDDEKREKTRHRLGVADP